MANHSIAELSKVLFDGENAVSDIKTMPGTDPSVSPDVVAQSLWESLCRVGLIQDGKLVEMPDN